MHINQHERIILDDLVCKELFIIPNFEEEIDVVNISEDEDVEIIEISDEETPNEPIIIDLTDDYDNSEQPVIIDLTNEEIQNIITEIEEIENEIEVLERDLEFIEY